jgi:hypothetical protein
MLSSVYAEDVFLKFYNLFDNNQVKVDSKDDSPIQSFYDVLISNKQLTKSQSNFILRLLSKYQNDLLTDIPDLKELLDNPKWKHTFREIDTSRNITLHIDDQQIKYVLAQYPFSFKDTFFKEFLNNSRSLSYWDHDLKVQKIKLLDINLVSFCEMAVRYKFTIDPQLIDIVDSIEEIWSESANYIPHSVIDSGSVLLKNATENSQSYFNNNSTGVLDQDLFLAKSLGYPALYIDQLKYIDKIVASENNKFWIKSLDSLIGMFKDLSKWPAVIILDRATDTDVWAKKFIEICNEIDPSINVKICFRFGSEDPKGKDFNQWVKDNNLGGNLKEGQVFICEHKPPKWMFKYDDFDAKIIVSNGLYPSTNTLTESLLNSHHTVIFLGDIKPSEKGKKKIVEL